MAEASAQGGQSKRGASGEETRERLLDAAERLFAEQGLGVSSRQIGEAAGQANNSVVAYHFGGREELVAALLRRHAPELERRRQARVARLAGSRRLRDWLEALVLPMAEYLAERGPHTYLARLLAQLLTDPGMQALANRVWLESPSLAAVTASLRALVPPLPREVFEERAGMTIALVTHAFAEREHALHRGLAAHRRSWVEAAEGIADALVGLWRAPTRRAPRAAVRRRGAKTVKKGRQRG